MLFRYSTFLIGDARRAMCAAAHAVVTMLVSLSLPLMLTACGGGSGGGGGGLGAPAGGDGQPTTPSQYNIAQRSAAIDRIEAKFEELAAAGNPDAWNALKDYVLTQPEFADAGVGENQLWAKFTDGRYFLYLDNWKVPSAEAQSSAFKSASREALVPVMLASGPGASELPTSPKAKLFMFNFDEFKDFGGTVVLNKAAQALKNRGWEPEILEDVPVDALKSVGKVGLLYINTHSGVIGPDGEKQYAMVTSTQSISENEDKYADDLADGSLIYTRERKWRQKFGIGGRLPNYAITSKFVRKYWGFADNSLVILMACHGGEPGASDFRDALTAQRAGTIIGWNGSANPHGYEMVKRLFDRLAGANVVDPRTPPNRSFHFDDVWSYLEKDGYLFTPPIERGDPPVAVKRFGAGFDLTNPVITELQLAANNRMIIHGEFGTEPGKVSINGINVPATWSSDGKTIDVTVPTASNDPLGSYGDVVVSARGRTSNPRTLTSWRGQVTYLYEDLPTDGGTGILTQKIVVDLHLRGDPYAMRTAVNGPLYNNTWNVIPASDTKVTWSASGTRSFEGEAFESWSGSGDLGFETPFMGRAFSMIARIDAMDNRLELVPIIPQFELMTVTPHGGTNPPYKQPLQMMPENYGFYQPDSMNLSDHKPLFYGTYIPLDSQMNVAQSQYVANISSSERVTVKWTQMRALPSFDGSVGR